MLTASLAESFPIVEPPTTWHAAVTLVSQHAACTLPEAMHGRLERATAIALHRLYWIEEDGETFQAQSSDGNTWYLVNGACQCEDYDRAPNRWCKHRLAKRLVLRAQEVLSQGLQCEEPAPDMPPSETVARIPQEYLTQIHGRPFVRYFGLLAMAHEQGLLSLEATFVIVTETLVTAQATAIFKDGRRFTESGDATPSNVGAQITPHFARMALTRAKARALRDGLNVGICSVEEVA